MNFQRDDNAEGVTGETNEKPWKPTFITTGDRQFTKSFTEEINKAGETVIIQERKQPVDDNDDKIGDDSADEDQTPNEGSTTPDGPFSDGPADREYTNDCRDVYMKACAMLHITPSSYFFRHLSGVSLDIKHHGIGPVGAKAVAIALVHNSTIESLDLSNNGMGSQGLAYILEMLQVNSRINCLNVAGNCLSTTGARLLWETLRKNKTITKLDISDNAFKESDATYIARIMTRNKVLKDLVIHHNTFREEGGVVIGKSLENNSSLTSLDLSWNHLRQRGAVAISCGIAVNIKLKSVNLSWNGFGMEGCHEMGKALMRNRTLTELDLSANRVSLDAFRQLLRGVVNSKKLKILKVGINPITTDGAFAILRSVAVSESALEEIDLTDVSVDSDFLALLRDVQSTRRNLRVIYGNTLRHDEIRKEEVVRVLDTDDPVTVLFEYMKQKNLRLIDLLHNLDKDHSETVSREEFQLGLTSIDLPLSSRALDILMKKLDINKDGHVDYEELAAKHKEHVRKVTKLRLKADLGPNHYKGFDKLEQLREAVRLKISLNVSKGSQT